MHKLLECVGDRRMTAGWGMLAREYQILGFEGVVMTVLLWAARWLLHLVPLSRRHATVRLKPALASVVGLTFVMGMLATAISPVYAQTAPPSSAAQASSTGPLVITLRQAVEIALHNNTQVQLSQEETHAAKARSHQALAALLPNLNGSASQMNMTVNLRAEGLDFSSLPMFSAFNPFIGPFDTFDARAYLQQTLFNFSAIRQYQAARAGHKLSTLEAERARRDTIAAIAALYYGVLQAQAHIDATQANIRLDQSLLDLAEHQKDAGVGTAVDVTRAQVQLAQQQQNLLSNEVAYEDAKLRLLKAMGKSVGSGLKLLDGMTLQDVPSMTVTQALETAQENRVELQSQAEREKVAKLQLSAAKGERLPSLAFVANYGSSGLTPEQFALPTRAYGVTATIPIFDGGRREGRIAEQSVRVRQEDIRMRDTEQQVEMEVRMAMKTIESARQQVAVAEENLKLAETELELSRDRFQEGVTNNIEVVQAQTSLEQARDRKVDALYLFNLARVNLDRALGEVEKAYQ